MVVVGLTETERVQVGEVSIHRTQRGQMRTRQDEFLMAARGWRSAASLHHKENTHGQGDDQQEASDRTNDGDHHRHDAVVRRRLQRDGVGAR